MSWLWLLSTAWAGGYAPVDVAVDIDPGPWLGAWAVDTLSPEAGEATLRLLPGTHTLHLGGDRYDFVVRQDGSISEQELALASTSRQRLEVQGVEVTLTGPAGLSLDTAAPPRDGVVAVVPGAAYRLDLGQVGLDVLLRLDDDGQVWTNLLDSQATTGHHRLDILTRKLVVEPRGYTGIWWTSADPRTAQMGKTTLELVPMLPYGAAAGLRDRFAFAFRVSIGGSTEVLATRGAGNVETGKGWLRFSIGGSEAATGLQRLLDDLPPPSDD